MESWRGPSSDPEGRAGCPGDHICEAPQQAAQASRLVISNYCPRMDLPC